jgi:hypothetical protein
MDSRRNRRAQGIGDQGRDMTKGDGDNDERRGKLVKAGVAVGIGSAAIVAALLYASKVKKPRRR